MATPTSELKLSIEKLEKTIKSPSTPPDFLPLLKEKKQKLEADLAAFEKVNVEEASVVKEVATVKKETAKTPAAKEKKAEKIKKVIEKKADVSKKKTDVKKSAKENVKDAKDFMQQMSDKVAEFNKGRSASSLSNDAKKTANKPGKHKSAEGKIYYEHRPDHTDIEPKDGLAKGGKVSNVVPKKYKPVYLGMYRKKIVVVSSLNNELWANEYFKEKNEAIDFAKQNKLELFSEDFVSVWDKKQETPGGKPIFTPPSKLNDGGIVEFPKYGLRVNLDERGEYSADVVDEYDNEIYEISSAEQMAELIEDGFLKYKADKDLKRLAEYLISMKILPKNAEIMSADDFENYKSEYQIGDHSLDEDDEEFNKGGKIKIQLTPGLFTITGDKSYPGWHDPNKKWNGFATPIFDKKTAIKILEDSVEYDKNLKKESGHPKDPIFEFKEEKEALFYKQPEFTDEGWVEVKPLKISVDDKKIVAYPLGSYEWVWEEASNYAKGGIIDKEKVKELAIAFSKQLRKDISAEDMIEVNRRNKTPEYVGACATHDFIDPNQTMLDVFEPVTGHEFVFFNGDKPDTEKQFDADSSLMDAAWNLAKHNDFDVEKIKEDERFAKGGRIKSALMRDRKYSSQEEWEKRYKRSGRARHYMADGGLLPTDYPKGSTIKSVWNSWTKEQKQHFINDHSNQIAAHAPGFIDLAKLADKKFADFTGMEKMALENVILRHISEGRYEHGGNIPDADRMIPRSEVKTGIIVSNHTRDKFLSFKFDAGTSQNDPIWVSNKEMAYIYKTYDEAENVVNRLDEVDFFTNADTAAKALDYDTLREVTLYADGGEITKPSYFGQGTNITLFGYQTNNFDICPMAVEQFTQARNFISSNITGKKFEEQSAALVNLAKEVDSIFHLEKIVFEEGFSTDLTISTVVKAIALCGIFNFTGDSLIDLSFLGNHVASISRLNSDNHYATGQMMISVDGGLPITFDEFKKINTADGVEPLLDEEFERVKNLQPGESFYLGHGLSTQIKRIFAYGGRIKSALMRDRKYLSQQDHEQSYNRLKGGERKGYNI